VWIQLYSEMRLAEFDAVVHAARSPCLIDESGKCPAGTSRPKSNGFRIGNLRLS
jgi:hypothetical protein